MSSPEPESESTIRASSQRTELFLGAMAERAGDVIEEDEEVEEDEHGQSDQRSNELMFVKMKAEKANRKRKFTRCRRAVIVALRDGVEEEAARSLFGELEMIEDVLNGVFMDVLEWAGGMNDALAVAKVTDEMEEAEKEMKEVTRLYQEFLEHQPAWTAARNSHPDRPAYHQYAQAPVEEPGSPLSVISLGRSEGSQDRDEPGDGVALVQENQARVEDSDEVVVTTSVSGSSNREAELGARTRPPMEAGSRRSERERSPALPVLQPAVPTRSAVCVSSAYTRVSETKAPQLQVAKSPGQQGSSTQAPVSGLHPTSSLPYQSANYLYTQASGPPQVASSHQAMGIGAFSALPGAGVSASHQRAVSQPPPVKQPSDEIFKQLKAIQIPVFGGDKQAYASWKAAFMACVGSSSARADLKLLHLRQYLSGDALASIESLGYTPSAYEAAMRRLDRKFGGDQRQLSLQYEQVEACPIIRSGRAGDLQKFADLLDVLVVNLLDSGKGNELGDGLLYRKLLAKLPAGMLTQFNRWCHQKPCQPGIQALLEWVTLEAEFAVGASEALDGVGAKDKPPAPRNAPQRSYFGGKASQNAGWSRPAGSAAGRSSCRQCGGPHGVWQCKAFQQLSVANRWRQAKQHGLCYRCLGGDHQGHHCPRTRPCSVSGCNNNHHYLLHRDLLHEDSRNPDAAQSNKKKSGNTAAGGMTADKSQLSPAEQFCNYGDNGSGQETGDQLLPPAIDCLVTPPYAGKDQEQRTPQSFTEGETESTKSDSTMMVQGPGKIALRTVSVVLENGHKSVQVNALLDDGSTTSYLNGSIANQLGVSGELRTFTVHTLNGKQTSFTTRPVSFTIGSMDGSVRQSMTALTADSVTGNLRPVEWVKEAVKYPHLREIPFARLAEPARVDLLIGSDYAELLVSQQEVVGPPGQPVARHTPLGWTCVGRVTGTHSSQRTFHSQAFQSEERATPTGLETALQQFWQIDSCGTEESFSEPGPRSLEEETALDIVKHSLKKVDGRYQVSLPWNNRKRELCNNLGAATKRLGHTERKLLKDPFVAQAYGQVFQAYQRNGYIRELAKEELGQEVCWYLSHFPIVRPQKTTTKVRIVFDAAASCHGLSLNDAIYPGPKLQRELFDVLTRFRQKPIAVGCDVTEMYLQVSVAPADRKYLRFVWRDLDPAKPLRHFEFNRLVFGVNAAPFIAQYVAQQTAREHLASHPLAAEAILASTYMDDTMDSTKDVEQGQILHRELMDLWGEAKMTPRKWVSNSPELLRVIPAEARATQLDLSQGELPSVKTLGVSWDGQADCFFFSVQPPDLTNQRITKRFLLAKVASVFDPLGFLAPFVTQAKILMQESWVAGIDWDEPVPDGIDTSARQWFNDLAKLSLVRVPRCLIPDVASGVTLHVFCDASSVAYGAVVYSSTVQRGSEGNVRLAGAKSRVAPTRTQSIPRLELLAAVLGLQLARKFSQIMTIAMSEVIFWSDSATVLLWIRSYSRRFKPFVANRISHIQTVTSPSQWRYVPSSDNPADLASRGAGVEQLVATELWWQGPAFLQKEESEWPAKIVGGQDPAARAEARKAAQPEVMSFMSEKVPSLCSRRFSDWTRVVRVRAWAIRFITNCRGGEELSGELTGEEMDAASLSIIKEAQHEAFAEDLKLVKNGQPLPLKSRLARLSPRLDDDGLLRCDGRTKLADWLPFDVRFPILLPRKHPTTRLIVKDCHEQRHHGGTNETLAALSDHYLVEAAREEIRDWEKDCMVCRRLKARAGEQIMAPLPAKRLCEPLRAFSRVAVDYGGPFETMQGRGKTRHKRYLCLFTCLLTRAVHLEMAYALDANSFLNAFNRMANRRGCPMEVLSDNGGNFVNADRQLRELVGQLNNTTVRKAMACRRVKWSFNPPLAPHFGGVHEAMIRAAKRALHAILGDASVTDEELVTALSGAESLVNSRPITYQSASPKDPGPLTPNHFLHGMAEGQLVIATTDEKGCQLQRRWRYVQMLIDHFWHRWLKEFVPRLNQRMKWRHQRRDLAVDDVVLVMDSSSPRGRWPLGRVTEVFPGPDGHVRVVAMQVGGKTLKRSITRVCPLEC
eukprot:scpid5959/ scgid16188/ 